MSSSATAAVTVADPPESTVKIEDKQQLPVHSQMQTASADQTIPLAAPSLSPSASSSHLSVPSLNSMPVQLSALERDAQVLSQQFQSMLTSIQSSQNDLSAMTVEYMRSLKNSSLSTSSSVGILLDTHTSLIRKMLIAAQQSAGMDALERSVETTKNTLSQMEKGVEALLADEALQRTRAELTAGLQAKQATIVESEDEEEHDNSQQEPHDTHGTTHPDRGNVTFAGVSPIATHDTELDSSTHASLQASEPSSSNTSLTFSAFSTPIILAGGGTSSGSGGGAHSGFNSPLPPPSMNEHIPPKNSHADARNARNSIVKPNPIDDIEPL